MKERLQKLIAQAGLCSRRGAEEWIAQGKVTVNGGLARLGDSADPETDLILIDGRPLPAAPAQTVTVLLYKPRGVVTTLDDEKGRRTVADLLPPELGRLYPVGRLDQFSEGLLLMTNDGALAQRLTHPAGEVRKTYRLWVSGWREGALDLLRRPIVLDGRPIAPPQVRLLWAKKGSGIRDQGSGDGGRGSFDSGSASAQDDTTVGADITSPACRGGGPASRPVEGCSPPEAAAADSAVGSDAHIAPVIAAGNDAAAARRQEASGDASLRGTTTAALEITIHEGRNRQIRRMAQAAGLTVTRLKRVAEGGLTLGELKPGEWRKLTQEETKALEKDN